MVGTTSCFDRNGLLPRTGDLDSTCDNGVGSELRAFRESKTEGEALIELDEPAPLRESEGYLSSFFDLRGVASGL